MKKYKKTYTSKRDKMIMNKYVIVAQKWAKFSKEVLEGRRETFLWVENCLMKHQWGKRRMESRWVPWVDTRDRVCISFVG